MMQFPRTLKEARFMEAVNRGKTAPSYFARREARHNRAGRWGEARRKRKHVAIYIAAIVVPMALLTGIIILWGSL